MMAYNQKSRLSIVAAAVSIALAGAVAGCNSDNNSSSTELTTKDNSYYKSKAKDLVAKMTTDEKLNMLVGPGYSMSGGSFGINTSAVANLKNDVSGVAGYISGVLNTESGLDIAASKLADGPAGIRISPTRDGETSTYYATGFPVGTVLASTWNPETCTEP